MSRRKKKVYQYTLAGDFVREYDSMKEAGELNGLNPARLLKQKVCGGWRWKGEKDEKGIGDLMRFNRKRQVARYSRTHELLETYPSIETASRLTDISAMSIIHCCKGRTKTGGGFIWKYFG